MKMEPNVPCKSERVYVPHKLRSRPFRCIILPAICVLIFITYWLILCPIIYVSVMNEYLRYYRNVWQAWWPTLFWLVALFIYLLITVLVLLYWRCIKKRQQYQNTEQEKRKLMSPNSFNSSTIKPNPMQLYHVSIINDNEYKKSQLSLATDQTINAADMVEKNFPKCSIKRKPDQLKFDDNIQQETSKPIDAPKSPMTPRDLFFIDLIQAANVSPITFVPCISTFLDNERRFYYHPENININCTNNVDSNNRPSQMQLKENDDDDDEKPEFFIANVENRRSLATEVFMYVNANEDDNCLTNHLSNNLETNENVQKPFSIRFEADEKQLRVIDDGSTDHRKTFKCNDDDEVFEN